MRSYLQRTGRDQIKEVTFISGEVGGEHEDDKQSRLDIVVRTQAGELINIEMQLSNQNNMMRRTLYYWSRLFVNQLQSGKGYHTLLPTITINICNFTLFNTEHYHNTYHLYEDSSLQRLSAEDDVLEIHFIEMTKFIRAWHNEKLDPLNDILVRWLLLLGMVDARKQKVYDDIYKELEALAMKDERIKEAFNTWEEISQTPDTIIAYQSRLKTIIDEEAKLDYARYKGEEKGIEQGLQEGEEKKAVEVIITGAKNGLEIPMLAKLTGYSVEKVVEILKENR